MALRVWITRAEPGASATADRVRTLGHEPVVAPLLEVREVAAVIDLEGVTSLAFTSANGVEAFARQCGTRGLPVYAIGQATAAAARLAGFAKVASADGDVSDLARLILAHAPAGRVLIPGARERAGDLRGMIEAGGVEARDLTVYETLDRDPPAGFDPADCDLALIHSPKAGRALAAMLAQSPAPDLEVVCISLAAAAPLAATPLARLDAAAEPNETALLALI